MSVPKVQVRPKLHGVPLEEIRHAHREICSRCHDVSRVGFAVPNDIWELATHHSERNAIICLACFTKLADERGVEWDRDIKLFPVSWLTLIRTTRAKP